MLSDSIDKIVGRYFATVARSPFTFKGKVNHPKRLKVSPLLLRGYTCPEGCGGCCFKFSLDYLPSEKKPIGVVKRMVEFDGRSIEIWTDWQESNQDTRCKHLQREDGRCGIHAFNPFSCDFELIRSLQSGDDDRPNVLTQKLFGRGWSFPRVDGGKGALCKMVDVSPESVAEVVRKLKRLKKWADHFGVDTWVDNLIEVVESGTLARRNKAIEYNPSWQPGLLQTSA